MAEVLDVSRDVDRADRRNRRHAAGLQPSAEFSDGPNVSAPGVRVSDLGGEELEETVGGAVARCRDEGGSLCGGKSIELGHKIAVVGVKPSITASLSLLSGTSTGSITNWILGLGRSNDSRTNHTRKRIQHRRVVP
jgi:hypothetical protein